MNRSQLDVTEGKIKCDSFEERISVLAEQAGSASALARMAGVSESVVRKWRNGTSEPSRPNLIALARATGVSLAWLVAGEGSEKASAEAVHSPENGLEDEFALVPGYNIQVAAGTGTFPDQEQPTRKLAFRRKWLRYRGLNEKDLVLVFAKGDSMEPTISDNNTLMIDTSQRDLTDGAIYVIRVNSHLVVKRVQTLLNRDIMLLSDNESYHPETLKPEQLQDLEVIGKAVWIGKDL